MHHTNTGLFDLDPRAAAPAAAVAMQEKANTSTSTSVFEELRAAAAALVKAHPEVVRVDDGAIERLAAQAAGEGSSLTAQDVAAKAERVGMPLKFGNALEELNFHATAALLSFGAAYEGGHPHLAESARDTVLFGLIGLHLTKADLHAGFLCAANRSDVSSYFAIDPMESVPHESIPAIRIERPGPLSTYVDDLVGAMNSTGHRLKELGAPDMARFVLAALKDEGTAARLVAALAAAFPASFGEALPGPEGGFVSHKKALLLAGEAHHRLRHTLPELALSDFAKAPGYATPAIITHLVELGVLKPGAGADEATTNNEEAEAAARVKLLGDSEHVGVLAAAAVVALDAWAAKWEAAPLDLAYYLDEVYGKEAGKQQERQGEQEPQGEGHEAAGTAPVKFVPPRGQTVM